MKNKKQNISNFDKEKTSRDLLRKMDIEFAVTKEDAWKSIEEKISAHPDKTTPVRTIARKTYSIAAIIILLISSTFFLRYYSVNYSSGNNTLSIVLPDNSSIELNANSSLKFNPLWWKISRNLSLTGNADFQVTKGNRFKVSSSFGSTEVLGTTFKIESAEDYYKVACLSGSVKVTSSKSDISAVLMPNEVAAIDKEGIFEVRLLNLKHSGSEDNINENDYITMKNEPIEEVFKKIESIFGVNIEISNKLDLYYTGNFKTGGEVKEMLNAVCLPFELNYVQLSENSFRIYSIERDE